MKKLLLAVCLFLIYNVAAANSTLTNGSEIYLAKLLRCVKFDTKSYHFINQWFEDHKNNQINVHCHRKSQKCIIIAINETWLDDVLHFDLLLKGYAVANGKYCTDQEMYMMQKAQQEKRGLWALGWNETPSEFRKVKTH